MAESDRIAEQVAFESYIEGQRLAVATGSILAGIEAEQSEIGRLESERDKALPSLKALIDSDVAEARRRLHKLRNALDEVESGALRDKIVADRVSLDKRVRRALEESDRQRNLDSVFETKEMRDAVIDALTEHFDPQRKLKQSGVDAFNQAKGTDYEHREFIRPWVRNRGSKWSERMNLGRESGKVRSLEDFLKNSLLRFGISREAVEARAKLIGEASTGRWRASTAADKKRKN